jgi:Zn-dependent protease
METAIYYVLSALAVLITLTVHEYCHGYAAYKMGDDTAKNFGRLTLNPIKHLDPIGALCMLFFHIGWAKPVPINPYNFRKYRSGAFWTSAAGIIVNYLSAFLFCPIYGLIYIYVLPRVEGMYAEIFFQTLFSGLVIYSLSFCVFNLLPFYPLDGFRMVDALARRRGKFYWFLRQYGYYILLGLIFLHFIAGRIPYLYVIDVLGYVLSFVRYIFGAPITLFWNWIFKLCGLPLSFTI